MSYGKSIELFLANGSADSIITAELSNWNGKAIKIPRIELPTCDRTDIQQVGVYFLFCKEEDGTDSVYIGEAENVKERLIQHIRDYQAEKEKYYWNTAVIFIGRDLNKALIRYLENRFVEVARNCNRYKVLTKNTYRNTVMKESQIAVMEEFIDNVKILINTLGYKVLEPVLKVTPEGTPDNHEQEFYMSIGNASAVGVVTSEGFVLRKGACVNKKTSVRSLGTSMTKRREQIFADGKVDGLTTNEDILFSSSSAAADFVLGYSVSGPATWKNKEGYSMKELDERVSG